MEFTVCEEMQKLRDKLDKNNIPWEDVSDDMSRKGFDYWICRTHFKYKNYKWSVIHGYGTYGGIMPFATNHFGMLLEVMSNAVNCGEPIGSCTADEVWEMMEKV